MQVVLRDMAMVWLEGILQLSQYILGDISMLSVEDCDSTP